ncbi:MAG TPA: hypothetical protein DIT28_15875 [Oxalobacteraceae bacterium]|jgi:hypothetical protein|nr:hypothetical protein [Oxalobacteraceae bacterium]HCN90630.1 hypothetical protein [Oxalobacteraceae bacterium]
MEKKNTIARRTFFSGLGLGLAAAAALKLSQTIPTSNASRPAQDEPDGDGYRLTEHIKKYYRSTTI